MNIWRLWCREQVNWFVTFQHNISGAEMHPWENVWCDLCNAVSKAESFYNVKYWNINHYVKCSSENYWFLVCCFFSVIWNASKINVFKTKRKLKCRIDFFGKLFWNLETPGFIFMFSLLRFIWLTFDVIIDVHCLTL